MNSVLVVGDVRALTLLNDVGTEIQNAVWSVSSTALAELIIDDDVVVRGRAPGQVTITATALGVSTEAVVTVVLPAEVTATTERWTLPPGAWQTYAATVVSAQNDNGTGPDRFVTDGAYPVVVRAISNDGRERWLRTFESEMVHYSTGMPNGDLLLGVWTETQDLAVMLCLNGHTGAERWRVPVGMGVLTRPAIRHDGSILYYKTNPAGSVGQLVIADGLTGASSFTHTLASHAYVYDPAPCWNPPATQQVAPPVELAAESSGDFLALRTTLHEREIANCGGIEGWTIRGQSLSLLRLDASGQMTERILQELPYNGTISGAMYAPLLTGEMEMIPTADGGAFIRATTVASWTGERHDVFVRATAGGLTTATAGSSGLRLATLNDADTAFVDDLWSDMMGAVDSSTPVPLWQQSNGRIVASLSDGLTLTKSSDGHLFLVDSVGVSQDLGAFQVDAGVMAWNRSGGLTTVSDTGTVVDLVGPDTSSLSGAWPLPDGNEQRQRRALVPALNLSATHMTRGDNLKASLTGVTASNILEWRFEPDNTSLPPIVRSAPLTSAWVGTVVVEGTVRVTIQDGTASRVLSRHINVVARDWSYEAVAPTEVNNGTNDFNLPEPPVPNSRLGEYRVNHEVTWNRQTINDGGPNEGLVYLTSVLPIGTFKFAIVQTLKSPSSTFYTSQCGTFHPVTQPNGFISGPVLLANTRQHEGGLTPVSHYNNYASAVATPANDLRKAFEDVVGTTAQLVDEEASQRTTDVLQRVNGLTSTEPCGGDVRYDSAAACTFRGNINHSPYQACP